jgi:tetrathionate reductase subunit B
LNLKKVKYGMIVDLRRCIGCHTCEVACKMENTVPVSVWQSWVKEINKGTYPDVSKSFLPILCNHCTNAICVTVCPTKASFKRDDGIVEVDPHKCIGCRYCMAACPYAVRYIHPIMTIVRKCNFCSQRVDNGLKPACVDACPVNARIFGNLEDSKQEISILKATNPVQSIKPDAGTEPNVFYIGLDGDSVTTLKEEG